jgi:hypothetical protein
VKDLQGLERRGRQDNRAGASQSRQTDRLEVMREVEFAQVAFCVMTGKTKWPKSYWTAKFMDQVLQIDNWT